MKQYPRKELYDGSWRSVANFRARTNSLDSRGSTDQWCGGEDTYKALEMVVRKSVEHVVLECHITHI